MSRTYLWQRGNNTICLAINIQRSRWLLAGFHLRSTRCLHNYHVVVHTYLSLRVTGGVGVEVVTVCAGGSRFADPRTSHWEKREQSEAIWHK